MVWAWPSGLPLPKTASSFARASSSCSRPSRTSPWWPHAAISTRFWRRSKPTRPTWFSRTSGCLPTRPTRGYARRRPCVRHTHETGVVVLSQYGHPSYALALLENGSDRRGVPAEAASARARRACEGNQIRGRRWLGDRSEDRRGAGQCQGARRELPLAELTPREREVLAEIAQGKSNTAIAESLVLTKRAVEKHINSIFLKLNLSEAEDVSKRVKAALVFLTAANAPPQ